MSSSSPADLAVAFRSLPRRLEQAPNDDTPPAAVDDASSAVQRAVSAAATILGAAATVEGVAAAIERRVAADWDDADLRALQAHATAAAKAIRDLENLSQR